MVPANECPIQILYADVIELILALLALSMDEQLKIFSSTCMAHRRIVLSSQLNVMRMEGCGVVTKLPDIKTYLRLYMVDLIRLPLVSCILALKSCPYLTKLIISDCPKITDLKPISGCTSLSALSLSAMPGVTDISPLSGCEALSTFAMFKLPNVTDILPLLRCTALHTIRIGNRLSGISEDNVARFVKDGDFSQKETMTNKSICLKRNSA
jgi:hypothetical protein